MLGIIEGLISIAKDLVSIAESVCKHSNKEKRLSHEQVVSLIRDYAKDICDDSPIVQLPAIEALIKLAEQYEEVRRDICNILCMFLVADSKSITFAETKKIVRISTKYCISCFPPIVFFVLTRRISVIAISDE